MPSGLSRSANRSVIFRPGSPVDLEPDDAGEVLAHVEHVDARLGLGDRLRASSSAKARTGGAGMPLDDRIQLRRRRRPEPQRLSSKPGESQPRTAWAMRAS